MALYQYFGGYCAPHRLSLKKAELPSLALLDDLSPREETPAQTPWWIIALRLAILALVILGLSRPSITPQIDRNSVSGPILLVIDNGWTSAARWSDYARHALSVVDEASENARPVHILWTSDTVEINAVDQSKPYLDLRRLIQSSQPTAWAPDRSAALNRLTDSALKPGQIIWLSDALDHADASSFGEALSQLAPTEIRALPPLGVLSITSVELTSSGAQIHLTRLASEETLTARIIARTLDGASIASESVEIEAGQTTAIVEFALPAARLNTIAKFDVMNAASTGQVWLWDDTALTPRVALADPTPSAQPLLEEFYYVRKALAPHTRLVEGNLSDVIVDAPDAIVLGDRAQFTDENFNALTEWIEQGGALIRFSGPKLAAAADDLTPTPLRPASRSLGGVLAWDDPQGLATFPDSGPFLDLQIPDDVKVRQQVLAQPGPDLSAKTWARLEDGTPLVTASTYGRGAIILFHVTATPDWSDLPYSGVFVDMLRRAVASGASTSRNTGDGAGVLTPERVFNGFGDLVSPPATLAPIPSEAFGEALPSKDTPPGLYLGPQGSRALNVGGVTQGAIASWPSGATVVEDADTALKRNLGGALIAAGLALLALDLIVSLLISGRLSIGRNSATVAACLFSALVVIPASDPVFAQTNNALSDKQIEAALELRFAYIETGDPALDRRVKSGLTGLGWELFKRTAVEPAEPHAIVPGIDAIELYPMIFFAPRRDQERLSDEAISALNSYIRSGGALVIDTRDLSPGKRSADSLSDILGGLDVPPLAPTPENHVLHRSFYLLDNFPGRLGAGSLWIDLHDRTADSLRADGVSSVFIGASDWISAWAIDDNRQFMFSMDGRERQRELAYRFGINLVMYILNGNYKEDQVHLPALLERLGEDPPTTEDRDRIRTIISPTIPTEDEDD